ncbi:MAG: hypothetical protein ACUVV6_04220 [Thermoplasmatota archaeon]
MAKMKAKGAPEEPPRAGGGLWAVPLLALLDVILYFLISMGVLTDFGLPIFWWKVGSVAFQLVLCAILVTSHAFDRMAVSGDDEEEAEGGKGVVEAPPKARARPATPKPARAAPAAPRPAAPRMRILGYPKKVSGEIYAITMVNVGDGRALKLRTPLGRACLLCDEQDACWSAARRDLEVDRFRSNVDCRAGLKLNSSGM